jgi:hypothetical protein
MADSLEPGLTLIVDVTKQRKRSKGCWPDTLVLQLEMAYGSASSGAFDAACARGARRIIFRAS